MLVLFDHATPKGLIGKLPGHTVHTAQSKGWDTLSNGALLDAAEEAGFELLLTTDRRIRCQQSLRGRRIALVVLIGTRNGPVFANKSNALPPPLTPRLLAVTLRSRFPSTRSKEVWFDSSLGRRCSRPQVVVNTRKGSGEPKFHQLEPDYGLAKPPGHTSTRRLSCGGPFQSHGARTVEVGVSA